MERLRHRLTDVSSKGQRRSVDQNTLRRSDLDEFIACCNPKNRHERKPTWTEKNDKGRWPAYDYEEPIKRDKINLDILIPSLPFAQSASRSSRLIRRTPAARLWLKDEALEESANLPAPEVIAADIVKDLEAALQQFAAISADLKKK